MTAMDRAAQAIVDCMAGYLPMDKAKQLARAALFAYTRHAPATVARRTTNGGDGKLSAYWMWAASEEFPEGRYALLRVPEEFDGRDAG